MSPEQAAKKSGGRLRDILLRKQKNPPGKTWRDIDDRNNFGPAFFEAVMGRPE